MEYDREEQLDYIEGSFLLIGQEISNLMSEEEKELENIKDENRIAIFKERFEKYEELFMLLHEAEGKIEGLRE